MSNDDLEYGPHYDPYANNDEINLASNNQITGKAELQIENNHLKKDLERANKKIKDYEETIKNITIIDIGNSSNLSNDDLINIMCNSSVLINNKILK